MTRRGILATGGVASVGFLASQVDLLRSTAQDSADALNVISPAATVESFLVTFVGVGRQKGNQLQLAADVARFLRAAQCEDEAHYHYLVAAGASAETTFTVPEEPFRDSESFLRTLMDLKAVAVGASMAAARQFASLGELALVEIGYQIGTVHAQHLALIRLFLGEQLPSDRAFAKWRFVSTADAAQSLRESGYLGGKGESYDFPGPLSRQCRGVFGLVPETTEDQIEAPLSSPVAR